jgi:hypothetical protein
MIVLGARFRALAGARAALRAVRATVNVAPGDVGVRQLGTTRYEAPAEDFVVAGRFAPGDVAAVIEILHANGGRIIEQRVEPPGPQPREALRALPHALATRAARLGRAIAERSRKRLRRPSPPLRFRTARGHRIER